MADMSFCKILIHMFSGMTCREIYCDNKTFSCYITWHISFRFIQCRDLCLIVGYTFVNGDVSNLPAAGVTFPPTPESPNTMQITATSTPDYTSLNGAPMPNEVLFSGSEGAYQWSVDVVVQAIQWFFVLSKCKQETTGPRKTQYLKLKGFCHFVSSRENFLFGWSVKKIGPPANQRCETVEVKTALNNY